MFTWKRDPADSISYGCYLGPWRVGSVTTALVARGNPNKWSAGLEMPDMKTAVICQSPEEAKALVEKRVLSWFKQIPPGVMGAILKENNR